MMNDELTKTTTLYVPFPPSANRMWRVGRGQSYLSKEYKEFIKEVRLEWLARNREGWRTSGRFTVSIKLFPPNRRRYDVDNRIKPTLDALTRAGVWDDDSLVETVTASKGYPDPKLPRAVVEISSEEESPT